MSAPRRGVTAGAGVPEAGADVAKGGGVAGGTPVLPRRGEAGEPAHAAGDAARGGAGAPRHRRRGASRGRGRRRLLVLLAAVVLGAVGLLAYAAAWYLGNVDQGPAGAQRVVTIQPGSSTGDVTAALVRDGVVGSGLAWRAYVFLHGSPAVGAGRYLLRRHEPFGAVLARLSSGPDVFAVVVSPGTTVYELEHQVATDVARWDPGAVAAALRDAPASPWAPAGTPTLDGLLGTGTYLVMPGEQPATLVAQMVARFDRQATAAGLAPAAAALGVTPYQAVVVASIVEKEGYYPKNFGGVARVVYNRLAAGMPLQMDSTVLYSLHQDGGPVTPADLAVRSPYNTYLHTGLPPTPICFPSAGALQAALHPPPGPWRYFELVSKNGTLAFETTLAQHERDVALAHQRGLP